MLSNREKLLIKNRQITQLKARITELEAEVAADNILLKGRKQLLDAIPECPAHGSDCVPHAVEWVKAQINMLNSSSGEPIDSIVNRAKEIEAGLQSAEVGRMYADVRVLLAMLDALPNTEVIRC